LLDIQIVTSFIRPGEINGTHLYNRDNSTQIYSTTEYVKQELHTEVSEEETFKIPVSGNLKNTQQMGTK
jgi:hypothetical protein